MWLYDVLVYMLGVCEVSCSMLLLAWLKVLSFFGVSMVSDIGIFCRFFICLEVVIFIVCSLVVLMCLVVGVVFCVWVVVRFSLIRMENVSVVWCGVGMIDMMGFLGW